MGVKSRKWDNQENEKRVEKATLERNRARARQRSTLLTGNRSTILTGLANETLGAVQTERKTLLGQ